jgi:hypothetical protein
MSGFAYNLTITTAMTPVAYLTDDEAAGKLGKVLPFIAALVMPFAAPMIWGALAGSSGILAGLGGAMTSAFGATASGIIGSAAVGAVANAGIAYLSGARGAQVWGAAIQGGISGGMGGLSHGPIGAGANAVGGSGPVSLAPSAAATAGGAPANLAIGATVANGATAGAGSVASNITSQISNIFSGGSAINRIGSALVNGIVNGESQARLDELVQQQQAALEGLSSQEQAAYAQRMDAARNVLNIAYQANPERLALMRMADVRGMESNQYRQAMRNIATRSPGGTLDFGQRKAYQRSGGLRIARDAARGYNDGWDEGTDRQASLFGQAAGLYTGPNFGPWETRANLDLGAYNARTQLTRSTAGQFADAFFGHPTYQQPTTPETNNQDNTDPFTSGQNNPWGRT